MQLSTLKWPTLALLAAVSAPAGGSAVAAPLPAPAASQNDALAQPVACWWRNGRRFCDGYRAGRSGYYRQPYGYGRYYGYGPSYRYGNARPEDLPFGSTEWWRAMDREGRGGYRR
jgi:hypothetical protein